MLAPKKALIHLLNLIQYFSYKTRCTYHGEQRLSEIFGKGMNSFPSGTKKRIEGVNEVNTN
jgi:hypothetical protein